MQLGPMQLIVFNQVGLTKTDIIIFFAFAGGILSSLMLFILVFGSRNKISYLKITLAGLAIGIFLIQLLIM